MKTADKVLYLDFDGVLHPEDVWWHPKRGIYVRSPPGHQLFEWMHILEELLSPYPHVAIVLSTSWVRERRFSFAKERLSPALQERVIGATFHHEFMRRENFCLLPRGVQIAQDVARRSPKVWLAIDDDARDWPEHYRSNLIQTDGQTGLSTPSIQEKVRAKLQKFNEKNHSSCPQ